MATILVVDDELGIRALLSEILTDEGHSIELAENAAQARAVHKDIATKVAFDAAKDAADRGVVNTPGILRPQYLVAYFDTPIVPSSPEFIREDVPTR